MNTIRAVAGILAIWAIGLFLPVPLAHAQALFGATSEPGATSVLYRIDPATALGTAIGPITGFSNVSGLAFHPATGVLYGVGFNSTGHVLLTVDPATGLGTEVGPTNVGAVSGCSSRVSDISFRSDGTLFAYAEPCDQFGTINVSSGAFTLLGDTGLGSVGNGIAFVSGGALYHAGSGGFDTLNQSTGQGTALRALTFPSACITNPRVNALDVQPSSDTLFALMNCGFIYRLGTLDIATGVITEIGETVPRLDAIAFHQPPTAIVPLTDFRDVRRPDNIAIGSDLGGTGHDALNFKGIAGAAGDAWITVYDPAPNPPPATFGSVSLTADVLIHPYNNKKGAGLLALYNEGRLKKGLALTLYSAGNTDSLVLATVDQAGKLTTLLTVRLGAAIAENQWYRVTMDVGVGAGLVSVLGAVFRHEDPLDPNSPVVTPRIGSSINLVAAPLGVGLLAGVDATGQVGVLAAAVSAANGSSVTNVSIVPQDDGDGGPIIFD